MSPRRAAAKAAVPVPVVDTSDCAFDRGTHSYTIAGVPVVSVMQVLNEIGFVDFSGVPAEILAAAQARGSYVHSVLHYLLEDDFDLDDVDSRFRGYIDSALRWHEKARMRPLRHPVTNNPIAVEYRFWDAEKRFAGTLDYLAWDPDDVLAITDFKTGLPSEVGAPLQTAAYEHGVRLTLFPDHRFPIRRRAVKLFPDGRPGRVEPYADERDLGMFFSALECVKFQRERPDELENARLMLTLDMSYMDAVGALVARGIPRTVAFAAISCANFKRNRLRYAA